MDPGLVDDSDVVQLADGTNANISLAVCHVEQIGSALGPPTDCTAIVAQSNDATFAVSVAAKDFRPVRPEKHLAKASAKASHHAYRPVILRIGVTGVPKDWLSKEVEHALARQTLELSAVAVSADEVDAATGFRNSPVLAPLREWGSFDLTLDDEKIGWLVSLVSDLRVTRQNNSEDLRPAELDEVSIYRQSIRAAIVNWLTTACASLPHKCDISK